MAWTSPRTWVANEVVTVALLNVHLRDNLNETGPGKATTKGDILAATAASALARVAVGGNKAVLIADSAQSAGIAWGKKQDEGYVTSTLTVNNSEVLTNVTGISFAVGANEVWHFRVHVFYNSGTTPDIKFGWTVPAGATMLWQVGNHGGGGATKDQTQTMAFNGIGADSLAVIWGYAETAGTAGTVQLQFAQNQADVSDTKVLIYTSFKAVQVG